MAYPGIEPKPPWWKAGDRSHGTALAAFSYQLHGNRNLKFIVDVVTPRLKDS
jgi:hypothetical protein